MTVVEVVPLIVVVVELLIKKLHNTRGGVVGVVLYLAYRSHELLLQEVEREVIEVVHSGELLVVDTPVEFPVEVDQDFLVDGRVARDGDAFCEGVESLFSHLRGEGK